MTNCDALTSCGKYSDAYIVIARSGTDGPKGISAFPVENDTPGLSFGVPEQKMGWRAQPTAQMQLDDCEISRSALIGQAGKGFSYVMTGLDGGRLNIAASALGGAQGALDATLDYMADRRAFGKSLNQFQALKFSLADMKVALQSARIFLRQATWKLDTGSPTRPNFAPWPRLT